MNLKSLIKPIIAGLMVFGSLSGASAQQQPDGELNGHKFVDLGLSVKWADRNLFAEDPMDWGEYFNWARIEPKGKETSTNVYTRSMGSIGGRPEFDAARAQWGDGWSIPTPEQWQELVDNCDWEWIGENATIYQGHRGYKVISKINGKHIFIPNAGKKSGDNLFDLGSMGYYWTDRPYPDNSYEYIFMSLDTDPRYNKLSKDDNGLGATIRAVCK